MQERFEKINLNATGVVFAVISKGGARPFLFGSVAAIFEMFPAEKLGISLKKMYDCPLRVGEWLETDKVRIFKCAVYRKCQNK